MSKDLKGAVIGKIVTPVGYDGTDFENVKTDADGHLQVDVLSGGGGTGLATEAKQDAQLALMKRHINEYNGIWHCYIHQPSSPGGSYLFYGPVVPAGKLYIWQSFSLENATHAMIAWVCFILASSVAYVVGSGASYPAAIWLTGTINNVLVAGDQVVGNIYGTTAGDDLHFTAQGYYINL